MLRPVVEGKTVRRPRSGSAARLSPPQPKPLPRTTTGLSRTAAPCRAFSATLALWYVLLAFLSRPLSLPPRRAQHNTAQRVSHAASEARSLHQHDIQQAYLSIQVRPHLLSLCHPIHPIASRSHRHTRPCVPACLSMEASLLLPPPPPLRSPLLPHRAFPSAPSPPSTLSLPDARLLACWHP